MSDQEQQLRFLSLKDVVAKTGLSAASIRRLINGGDFPQPFDLSAARVAYWEHEVDAWMVARAERGRKPRRLPLGGRKRAKKEKDNGRRTQ